MRLHKAVPCASSGTYKNNIVFSGDMCLGKNTARFASMRAQRVRAANRLTHAKGFAFCVNQRCITRSRISWVRPWFQNWVPM